MGQSHRISPARQTMIEYMDLAHRVPLIYCQREMNLAEVKNAREGTNPRIGWSACFVKAWGIAQQRVPPMRWSYLTVPYRRFYEHRETSITVAVERLIDEEPHVLGYRVSKPEMRPLREIDDLINSAANDPVESVDQFRRYLRYQKWPGFFRRFIFWYALTARGSLREKHFGNSAISSIHGSGAELVAPRSPLTSILTYGQVSDEGRVTVRLGFDHRVVDGMTAGKALLEMDKALQNEIRNELMAIMKPAA